MKKRNECRRIRFKSFDITVREVIVGLAIFFIMMEIGTLISGAINEKDINLSQKYQQALKIENDKDEFVYAMKTDYGDALVYGELKSVGSVTYKEIGKQYMYIEKVKEVYTKHYREVCSGSGKKRKCRMESYWKWDMVNTESKHTKHVTFLGVKFPYEKFKIRDSSYIKTISGGYHIRYKYYGCPTKYKGSIFANLQNDDIHNVSFYKDKSTGQVLDDIQQNRDIGQIIFWTVWTLLSIALVVFFIYRDNRWLE